MSDRRSQIIEAAIPPVLREGGGVSTAAIARAAGLSNGPLFDAFAARQDPIDGNGLTAKTGMSDAPTPSGNPPRDRETPSCNRCDDLERARRTPHRRTIVHLRRGAGLAGPAMRATADRLGAWFGLWIADALARGVIRGPGVDGVARLIVLPLDLVVDTVLDGDDEALAFDTLRHSSGLSE